MRIFITLTTIALTAILSTTAFAGPLTREQAEHRSRALEQLKTAIAAAPTDEAKVDAIAKAMTAERDVDVRRKIVEMSAAAPGPALDTFLATVLTIDDDAGVRSLAATTLGNVGGESSLAPLAKAAASDRTSMALMGDIGGRSSARRASIFAIAELAGRFPKLTDKAAAELRALPPTIDLKDNASLGAARSQALYQITHDDSLLKPFFEQLKGKTSVERVNGVVAFRFLKLKKAPAEVLKALDENDADVQSWAALVLGEIGDPAAVEPLTAAAGNAKQPRLVRVNAIHSLGEMRAAAAIDLLKKLADDPAVAKNAAMALDKIEKRPR